MNEDKKDFNAMLANSAESFKIIEKGRTLKRYCVADYDKFLFDLNLG